MAFSKKKFIQMKFPKIPPEKMVGEYLQSKMEERVVKTFPEWDVPGLAPAVKLVEERRHLDEAEQKLAEKKKEAEKRRKDIDDQWRDLAEKEALLKQNFIKFNKFVKENQEKRERAEKKIEEELALQERRQTEIDDMQVKYGHMIEVKNNMVQRIKEYKMYEDFLQKVVEDSPEFKGVDDILARYEALIDARKTLIERQERDLTALENARTDMMNLLEEKIFSVMGLNNQVANLFSRYENAKARSLHWETMVNQIKNHTILKLAEIHQVRKTCWDVYLQMCRRKKADPGIKEWDVEHQLLFIKSTLMELGRIVRLTKRRTNREINSSKAETPRSKQ